MPRSPIPSAYYALVVVQNEGRFLVIQERKHGQLWYLPAGRVEPGEQLTEAAVRETLEESGVQVALDGLLAVEHEAWPHFTRVRFVFTGKPIGDPTPLGPPGNEHALQGRWVTREEVATLDLRDPEVGEWFDLAVAGPVAPLSVVRATAPR